MQSIPFRDINLFLMITIQANNIDFFVFLLEGKSDVSQLFRNPPTQYNALLQQSIKHQRRAFFLILLRYGANLNAHSNSFPHLDERPLHVAAGIVAQDSFFLDQLISRGCDLAITDSTGRTVLDSLVTIEGSDAHIRSILAKTPHLLDHTIYHRRLPILHTAVAIGYPRNVHCLLESGADITLKDQMGLTALDYAAIERHPSSLENLKVLLNYISAQPMAKSIKQELLDQALQNACLAGNVETVRLLLESNADPNSGTGYFQEPYLNALHHRGLCRRNLNLAIRYQRREEDLKFEEVRRLLQSYGLDIYRRCGPDNLTTFEYWLKVQPR
jgi:ankyrin repeat protein